MIKNRAVRPQHEICAVLDEVSYDAHRKPRTVQPSLDCSTMFKPRLVPAERSKRAAHSAYSIVCAPRHYLPSANDWDLSVRELCIVGYG